jgi:hypothetical protein
MNLSAHWQRLPTVTFHSKSIVTSLNRSVSVVCNAKKKGKKGGKQKKGSLLGDAGTKPIVQPWQTTEVIMQHLLMIESYRLGAS